MKKIFTLLTVLLSLSVFAQLTDHLLLHYKFDGNLNDSSINNRHGNGFNIGYVTDHNGNPNSAASFNGIDSFVNFPNIAALKPQFPMSFSFWVNYTSEDFHHQVVFNTSFEQDHCTGVWFNSSLVNNGHAINFGNGAYAYSPSTRTTFLCIKQIATNAWHQIVVVMNSPTDMKIFVDCTQAPGSYSGTGGALVYSDTAGTIGRHDRYLDAPPDFFEGYIDDFMYWDRALTQDEVNELCAESVFSVTEFNSENSLQIYPNPASDKVFIESDLTGNKTLEVYNSIGQRVFARPFESPLPIDDLAKGVYLLRIDNGEKSAVKKLVID